MTGCHSSAGSWGRAEEDGQAVVGRRASPETGVTRLEKMKLSRLLAAPGHVNTCHVHWLFLMSINCIMTQ